MSEQYYQKINSTKQYQTIPYRVFLGKTVILQNTVLWKIFNMFDRIKLIKLYIYFNKIKIFSMFDVCLRRCRHQTLL
jgi:hypothetical protein